LEITQSHRLAEGKSKEKILRIPTASEPILCVPLTGARAITQYSPVILALTTLLLDVAYQEIHLTSKAVPTLELQERCRGSEVFGISGRSYGMLMS
jgi:hypothetical protein